MDDHNVDQSQSEKERGPAIDLDKMTEVLQRETSSAGGLLVPSKDKDRVVFRHPERKSLLDSGITEGVRDTLGRSNSDDHKCYEECESEDEGLVKIDKEEHHDEKELVVDKSSSSKHTHRQISKEEAECKAAEAERDRAIVGGGGNQPPTIEHGSLSKSKKKQSWCELIPMTLSSWFGDEEELSKSKKKQSFCKLIPMTISSWFDDEEEL